jgi:membrane-associated phospholipid phosphatase
MVSSVPSAGHGTAGPTDTRSWRPDGASDDVSHENSGHRKDTGATGSAAPRRHVSDLLRFVLGASVLLVSSFYATTHKTPGGAEEALFRLVNSLPRSFEIPLWVVMQTGSLAAVPISAGLALLARRPRLARDVGLAGSSAYALAGLVKVVIERGRPGAILDSIVASGAQATGFGFPSGHVAVATALATAAGPHLPRRVRRALYSVANPGCA